MMKIRKAPHTLSGLISKLNNTVYCPHSHSGSTSTVIDCQMAKHLESFSLLMPTNQCDWQLSGGVSQYIPHPLSLPPVTEEALSCPSKRFHSNHTISAWYDRTHTHTHTHKHTCWFLWFTGTFHRRNGFYTVQAVCAIALHLPYT